MTDTPTPADRATIRPSEGAMPSGARSPMILRASENGEAVGGSVFDAVGGHATFDRLVRAFYEGVRVDPVLWPMYPEDDLEGAVERLTLFLEQYWGGPGTYSEQRGHPRLRMRHNPYAVNRLARERWLVNMRAALDEVALPPLYDSMMWDYFERAATAMLNTPED